VLAYQPSYSHPSLKRLGIYEFKHLFSSFALIQIKQLRDRVSASWLSCRLWKQPRISQVLAYHPSYSHPSLKRLGIYEFKHIFSSFALIRIKQLRDRVSASWLSSRLWKQPRISQVLAYQPSYSYPILKRLRTDELKHLFSSFALIRVEQLWDRPSAMWLLSKPWKQLRIGRVLAYPPSYSHSSLKRLGIGELKHLFSYFALILVEQLQDRVSTI
jgi:hypothetical protein